MTPLDRNICQIKYITYTSCVDGILSYQDTSTTNITKNLRGKPESTPKFE